MKQGGQQLLGVHDYRNFCKMDVVNVRNYERELLSFDIKEAIPATNNPEDLYYIEFKGTAFLWHQVRNMVAVLFLIGAGKETPDIVSWLLNTKEHPRKPLYEMASEIPLILYDCGFEETSFTYNKTVIQKLMFNFETLWNRHAMKGTFGVGVVGGVVVVVGGRWLCGCVLCWH